MALWPWTAFADAVLNATRAIEDNAALIGKVALPRADVDDLVAIFQAGAYGATASPSAFLGQGPAREMLV